MATEVELQVHYRPIRDYSTVGNCHGSALISSTGSVDWCCLERFDADWGGCFSIRPIASFVEGQRGQRYCQGCVATLVGNGTANATLT